MIYRILMLAVIMVLSSFSAAADNNEERHFTINNTQFIELKSKQTGHAHELIVVLPAGYDSSSNKKYPVLYFLDAYWDLPLLAATYGNLMYDKVAPEFIMVGLSYPGDNVNYDQERLRDFTPTKDAQRPQSGGGPAFLRFIKESVVPTIEARYSVNSSERALSGSSLGGLFTLYALYEDPEFFDRYIAISPAAGWDNGYLTKVDADYAKNHEDLNARVFISYGTGEYKAFSDPIAALQQKMDSRDYHGLQLLNYKMEGLRHTSVKGEGYARGLIWAWKDITPAGPGSLEIGYKAAEK